MFFVERASQFSITAADDLQFFALVRGKPPPENLSLVRVETLQKVKQDIYDRQART